MMNRAARRALKSQMKRRGHEVVTLKGGPMDGWIVKVGAPALRPEWRSLYIEAAAEGLYREGPRGWMKPKWDRLSEEKKDMYRAAATGKVAADTGHGAGYYKPDSTGTEATWIPG